MSILVAAHRKPPFKNRRKTFSPLEGVRLRIRTFDCGRGRPPSLVSPSPPPSFPIAASLVPVAVAAFALVTAAAVDHLHLAWLSLPPLHCLPSLGHYSTGDSSTFPFSSIFLVEKHVPFLMSNLFS